MSRAAPFIIECDLLGITNLGTATVSLSSVPSDAGITTWWFTSGAVNNLWSNLGNWNSAADYSGVMPVNPPWTTPDNRHASLVIGGLLEVDLSINDVYGAGIQTSSNVIIASNGSFSGDSSLYQFSHNYGTVSRSDNTTVSIVENFGTVEAVNVHVNNNWSPGIIRFTGNCGVQFYNESVIDGSTAYGGTGIFGANRGVIYGLAEFASGGQQDPSGIVYGNAVVWDCTHISGIITGSLTIKPSGMYATLGCACNDLIVDGMGVGMTGGEALNVTVTQNGGGFSTNSAASLIGSNHYIYGSAVTLNNAFPSSPNIYINGTNCSLGGLLYASNVYVYGSNCSVTGATGGAIFYVTGLNCSFSSWASSSQAIVYVSASNCSIDSWVHAIYATPTAAATLINAGADILDLEWSG